MSKRTFFHELSPLARKLEQIRETTPPRLSEAKDWHECKAKQDAKLARRAARSNKGEVA